MILTARTCFTVNSDLFVKIYLNGWKRYHLYAYSGYIKARRTLK